MAAPVPTTAGGVVSGYTAGTVIRAAPAPGQTVFAAQLAPTTAPAQYVTAAAAGAPIVAPAQYVTPLTTTRAPIPTAGGTYVAAPAAPATTVIRSAAAPPGATIAAPAPALTGSVVRMAAPATVMRAAPRQVVQVQNRPPVVQGPAYTQGKYEQKHQEDAQLQNLKELRKTSGFKNVPVGDGLSALKAAASDGKLSREQFLAAYTSVLATASTEEAPDANVQNAVFDLFDRDGNDVVDMMELVCGISLLCQGTEDDKIQAVFNVFDENGDGFISMDEMFKFLTSVFKVVLTPNVMGVMCSMGVSVESPEDLASVTSLECFKTADLNHDGKLSITEFKNWFYAPRNDPSFLFSPVRTLLQ